MADRTPTPLFALHVPPHGRLASYSHIALKVAGVDIVSCSRTYCLSCYSTVTVFSIAAVYGGPQRRWHN